MIHQCGGRKAHGDLDSLQATKEHWEQELQSSPEKRTPTSYPNIKICSFCVDKDSKGQKLYYMLKLHISGHYCYFLAFFKNLCFLVLNRDIFHFPLRICFLSTSCLSQLLIMVLLIFLLSFLSKFGTLIMIETTSVQS